MGGIGRRQPVADRQRSAPVGHVELDKAGGLEHRYLLYNGPVKVRLMSHLTGDAAVAPELVERYEHALQPNSLADYPSPGFFGAVGRITGLSWLIIWFTNVMHGLLRVLHLPLPYGLAIVAITIIATGAVGNCDNSARISHRPALLRACFDLKGRLETARLLPVISVLWFNARSSS